MSATEINKRQALIDAYNMGGMAPCGGCGGGIWPETETFPLCEYCAAKAAEKKGKR